MTRPTADEYAPAHAGYVSLVPEDDVMDAMQRQSSEMQKWLAAVDEARAAHRYAPDKWSVKEVIGHIVDSERIIGYRALAVARGEQNPLPGFDEKAYVRNASFDSWKLGDLSEHYALVRRAHIVLFNNLPPEAWDRRGIANGFPISTRGMAYVIVGHNRHHLNVLHERYGFQRA